MMHINLNLFLFNYIFNNIFILNLLSSDEKIGRDNLKNIRNDLERIGFYFDLKINSYLISFFISLIGVIILRKLIITKDNKFEDPIGFLKNFLTILFHYSSALLISLYFLRLFNFSRSLLLIGIILYSILSFSLVIIFSSEKFNSKLLRYIVSIFFLIIFYYPITFSNLNNNDTYTNESNTITTSTVDNYSSIEYEPGLNECFEWLGSQNYAGCINTFEITSKEYYSESLNNIIVNNDKIYILDVFGRVFNYSDKSIFINISDKVLNRLERDPNQETGEAGLFSIAFHPLENYFLISYSDLEDNLVVEKYFLDENNLPFLENSEIILKIPNSVGYHYSGNLIWSDYFNDFILSVGDMKPNSEPFTTSEPLDTTSPRGKLILLNKEITKPKLLSIDKDRVPKKNILAYGLRNPWKTFEYENYLFVPDIGLNSEEELNVLNLDLISQTNEPFLLGWPHFEGTVDNNVIYNEIFLHEKGEIYNINDFIKNNTIMPNIYYSHISNEVYRAALIGGGVVENKNSKYFEHYFFADFLSRELFAYDFKKDKFYIFPLGEMLSYITSVAIHPLKSDTILLSTGSGNIFEIKLP